MKTKSMILALLLFVSFCAAEEKPPAELLSFAGQTMASTETDGPVVVNPPPPVIPPPPVTKNEIIFGVMGANYLNFYDETATMPNYTVDDYYIVEKRKIAVSDILYNIDAFGETVSTIQLPAIPAAVKYSGANFYLIKTIPPAEALAAGALYKPYSEIFVNYSSQGHWVSNQWETKSMVKTYSGDLVAYRATGTPLPISGTEQNIFLAEENGIFIYDYDSVTKTAKIKTDSEIAVTWTTNDFGNANRWLFVNGEWISNNGYSFSESAGLIYNDTALQDFNAIPYPVTLSNGISPTVFSAGIRVENSEDVSYWIEGNTGWLFRYVSSINSLQKIHRIYNGDGEKNTGIAARDNTNPIIYENHLYYCDQGNIMKIDLDSGLNTVFIALNARLYLMR